MDEFGEIYEGLGDRAASQRNEFLFSVGVIGVIGGLLLPVSGLVADLLLGFCFVLTGLLLVMSFSGKASGRGFAFPSMIIGITSLQLVLSVFSAKMVLSGPSKEALVSKLGGLIVGDNAWGTFWVFVVVVLFVFGIVIKATRNIYSNAISFTTDILSAKQAQLEWRFEEERGDSNFALLKSRLRRQVEFFVGMAGASRFMLCTTTIAAITGGVNLVSAIINDVVSSGNSYPAHSTAALGLGMPIQLSILIGAIASGHMVAKNWESGVSEEHSMEPVRKRVTASEVVVSDFEEFGDKLTNRRGNEPTAKQSGDSEFWKRDYFEHVGIYKGIVQAIDKRGRKVFVLAGTDKSDVPVTAAVKVAIEICKRGKRCLLVDVDEKRDAMSRVFDLEGKNGRVYGTGIENLHVCKSLERRWMGLEQASVRFRNKYDCVVVYAPSLECKMEEPPEKNCNYGSAIIFESSDGKSKLVRNYLKKSGFEIISSGQFYQN